MEGLQAQAAALSMSFETMGKASPDEIVNPAKWRTATSAINVASDAYRNAASSSGLLHTQQIKTNTETARYTDLLKRQKLGFKDMLKNSSIMKQVYNDQLKMQRMTVQGWGTDSQGRSVFDITMPKNVPAELDTWRNKIGFMGAALKSAGKEMVNFGKNTQWAGRQLMVGFTVPTAMFGVAAGKMAYDVDKAFTMVAKVYDTTSTSAIDKEQELSDLRVKSLGLATDLAKKYGSAIMDTLNVEGQLASQGFSGDDLLKMTEQVQRISALGDLDIDQSVALTTTLRTAFKSTIKDSEDLTKAFDFMNNIENATSLTTQDMAEAFPRAGSALAQLGVSVKQATVLLVAMKSAGVDPKEGANALKSASTRILNPNILKAAQPFMDGYADLNKISAQSNGNLFKFLQLLAKATQGMDNFTKQQGIAKLFGTYQFNRLNAALAGLGDNLAGISAKSSQTTRAIQMMNNSAAENAAVAAGELAQKQGSISGQMHKNIEVLKADIATMGKPFLQVGNDILKMVTKVVEGFNGLSDAWKSNIAKAAIGVAIFGPIVMITGLFFNLLGTIKQIIGGIITFGARWKTATVEEKSAQLITAEMNKNLLAQTEEAKRTGTTINTLAQEMKVLSAAYKTAAGAANDYLKQASMVQLLDEEGRTIAPERAAAMSMAGQVSTVNHSGINAASMPPVMSMYAVDQATPLSALTHLTDRELAEVQTTAKTVAGIQRKAFDEEQSRLAQQSGKTALPGMTLKEDSAGRVYYHTVDEQTKKTARATKDQIAAAKILGERRERDLALSAKGEQMAKDRAKAEASAVKQAAADADAKERSAKAAKRTQLAAGASAAAFGVGMLASGKIADYANTAAMSLMTISALNQTGMFTKLSGMFGEGGIAATRFGKAAGASVSKLGTAAKALGPMLLNPWTALGAAAAVGVGVAIYKIHQHMIEPQKQQEAINRSTQVWADTLGVIDKQYKALDLSVNKYADHSVTTQELADRINSTDDGKRMSDTLRGNLGKNDTASADMLASQEYIKILSQTNATAEDAERGIEALYLAAGDGMVDAGEKAKALRAQIGDIVDEKDLKGLWTEQINAALSAASDQLDERAAGISDMLYKELQSGNLKHADKILIDFGATFDGMSADKYAQAVTGQLKSSLDSMGMNNPNKIADLMSARSEFGLDIQSSVGPAGPATGPGVDTGAIAQAARAQTQAAADKLGISYDQAVEAFTQLNSLSGDQLNNLTSIGATQRQVVQDLAKQLNIQGDINTMDELRATNEWNVFTTTRANIKDRIQGMKQYWAQEAANRPKDQGFWQDQKNTAEDAQKIEWLNQRLRRVGMHEIGNLNDHINWQQLKQLENQDKINAAEANHKAALKASLDVYKDFTTKGYVDAMQSAMSAVMSAVSGAIDDNVTKSQQAASDALDKKISDHDDALDKQADRTSKHYDRLANQITNVYKRRTDAIQNEIDAEKKADDTRQKLYDNEMTRINNLIDAENRNIDFKVAIGSGQFDEAAKIFNEGIASDIKSNIDKQNASAEAASTARQDALQKQIDRLEKERDRALKQNDNAKDRAAKEIDNEKKKYDTLADLQKKHLSEQQDAYKKELDSELDIIMKYIPRNEAEAKKYLDDMSKKYDVFGQQWANGQITYDKLINSTYTDQMKATANDLKSKVNWAGAGFDGAQGMIRGMASALGMSNKQFRKWLGIEAADKRPKPPKAANEGRTQNEGPHSYGIQTSYHTGGAIGPRKGYAGSQSRSEQWINAEHGEYMMSKDAVNKFGVGFMDKINSGRADAIGGAGDSVGIGMIGRTIGRAMVDMFSSGLGKKVTETQNSVATGYSYSTSKPGIFGDVNFDAEQLTNAAIIASVGSSIAGISSRDIEIGIMTAITESGLRNIHGGDRDSQGLFQQRPSQGWGTVAQVTDPEYAARKFFSVLRTDENRADEAPWAAAQNVQHSAYTDGSNYAQYWNEAVSIFQHGLLAKDVSSGPVNQGPGGYHKAINGPVTIAQGRHDIGIPDPGWAAVDAATPIGTSVYAVGDGFVKTATSLRGYEPRRMVYGEMGDSVQDGYRSYGKYMVMQLKNGPSVLMAHLSNMLVGGNQNVKGGTKIAESGNTGYVISHAGNGAHLHLASSDGNPMQYLAKGGTTQGEGVAYLHNEEHVLTKPLSKDLNDVVSALGKTARATKHQRNHMPHQGVFDTLPALYNSALLPGTTISDVDAAQKTSKQIAQNNQTNAQAPIIQDGGKSFKLSNATLNAYEKTPAASTNRDMDVLTKHADVIFLQEINKKWRAVAGHLAKLGWGMFAGKGNAPGMRENGIAWNKSKFDVLKTDSVSLGNTLAPNILGGKYKRYANYALMKDKQSGREFYEVAAHTVPTPNFNPIHRKMFFEQWSNIDKLVSGLKASGAPVFLGGDVNERQDRPWWRTPEGLKAAHGAGVDYVFSDPRMAQFLNGALIHGMHTDHAGAQVSNYNIPSLRTGGEIMFDDTLINAHEGEKMLTKDLSKKLDIGINNMAKNDFANSGQTVYDIDIHDIPPHINKEELANLVIAKIEAKKTNVGRNRTVKH